MFLAFVYTSMGGNSGSHKYIILVFPLFCISYFENHKQIYSHGKALIGP